MAKGFMKNGKFRPVDNSLGKFIWKDPDTTKSLKEDSTDLLYPDNEQKAKDFAKRKWQNLPTTAQRKLTTLFNQTAKSKSGAEFVRMRK